MERLGWLYRSDRRSEQGDCILPNDIDKMLSWYRKAAAADSKYSLKFLVMVSDTLPQAGFPLGQMYEQGEIGAKKNLPEAIQFYEKATQPGDPAAAFHLGGLDEQGTERFNKNVEKASFYYARAMQNAHEAARAHLTALAESSDPEAQYALGYHYYHAKGDLDSAIDWCVRAEEQKDRDAENYLHTTAFTKEDCLRLAAKYERGEGVRKNLEAAKIFYEKAQRCDPTDADLAFHIGQEYQLSQEKGGFGIDYDKKRVNTAFRQRKVDIEMPFFS